MGYIVKLSDLPEKLDSIEPILDKIVEGDCIELMRRMKNDLFDLCLTDIPFNVGWNYGEKYKDTLSDSEYGNICQIWFSMMGKVSRRVIVKVPTVNIHIVLPAFHISAGYKWMLIQHSPNTTRPGYTKLHLFTNYLVSEGEGPKPWWDLFQNTKNKLYGGHPAEMPIHPMEKIINGFTEPDMTIIEPFLGSGTTIIAARRLGRHFVGCEINPDYCKIAERRLLELDAQPGLF